MFAVLVAQLELMMSLDSLILCESYPWVGVAQREEEIEDVEATEDADVKMYPYEYKFKHYEFDDDSHNEGTAEHGA